MLHLRDVLQLQQIHLSGGDADGGAGHSHCNKLRVFNLDNLICFDTVSRYETTNTIMTGNIVTALQVSLFEILNYNYFLPPFSHYLSLHLWAEAITDGLSDTLDQFAFNVNGIT